MHLHQVLGVILTIRDQTQLQILVLLLYHVLRLVHSLQFFSESDLDGVRVNEAHEFLIGKLEVLFYEGLHLEEGLG